MSDLGKVLGVVTASLVNARRIADQATASVAEFYRDTPLLEGMSLPRVRVPEMVVDLPVLIESFDEGEGGLPVPEPKIRSKVQQLLVKAAEAVGVKLTKTFLGHFDSELRTGLSALTPVKEKPYPAKGVIEAADEALLRALRGHSAKRFSEKQLAAVRTHLLDKVATIALESESRPPALEVTVVTAEIKETTAPANVARLQLTLKEEGMEWTLVERPDGTVTRHLTPE